MKGPVRILIVDDHAMVRGMLRSQLDAEPDMEVVGTVGNADEAVAVSMQQKPSIVLMDIDMPGMACFAASRAIQAACPGVRIVFLSAFFHDRYIEQAIHVKAWGYITKGESEDSVRRAIRQVARGIAYFSPEVQARIVVDEQGARLATGCRSRASTLTERETEVLRHLARGLSKKEIARLLHLSVNTVNRHTTSLMGKLDIHDRVDLTRFAIREGLAEA